MMLLEIHGANFVNKGATKMLDVTIGELRNRIPGVELVVDSANSDIMEREARGLTCYGVSRFWMSKPQPLFRTMTTLQASPLSRPSLNDINGFVDVSGFAYSSQWGEKPVANIAFLTDKMRRANKRIIFLPQAFGPFSTPTIQAGMKRIVENADLIYARDAQSFENLASLTGSAPANLKQAPDLTLFHGPEWTAADSRSKTALIVPNTRMMDQGRNTWSIDAYVGYMSTVAAHLKVAGFKITFLVHDTEGGDAELVRKITADSPHDYAISNDTDPWAIKEVISRSSLLIGSRFHALAAALSVGVPAIAVGWSHKYGELLRSFGQEDYDLTSPPASSKATEMIDSMLEPENYNKLVSRIAACIIPMRETNTRMWEDVASTLTASR